MRPGKILIGTEFAYRIPMTPKKALIVVSDQGFHWDELTDAYHVFDDAHWQIEVASPLGHPKVEPLSLRRNLLLHWFGRGTTRARSPQNAWWGRPVVEAIMRAKRLEVIKPEHYDAVFVCGGLGELGDLHGDSCLGRLMGYALRNGVIVGGRERILGSFHSITDQLGHPHVFAGKTPKAARATAWKVVEKAVAPEDVHGSLHVAEFLDKKSGQLHRKDVS